MASADPPAAVADLARQRNGLSIMAGRQRITVSRPFYVTAASRHTPAFINSALPIHNCPRVGDGQGAWPIEFGVGHRTDSCRILSIWPGPPRAFSRTPPVFASSMSRTPKAVPAMDTYFRASPCKAATY